MRIGIDLGGTKIEVAVLDDSNACLVRRRVDTPRSDYTVICRAIADLVLSAESEIGAQATVGVAIPGVISPTTGLINKAKPVCLIGRPFIADLEALLQRPVRAENDANCMIVSEVHDGAARGAQSAFGVIIGTGTGGGLVLGRQLISGVQGIAGEWGHNPMPGVAPRASSRACYCGRLDCIETYLCGAGLLRTYAEAGGPALERVEALVAAAQDGDECAEKVLAQYPRQFAYALGTIINVIDPAYVVLAGGVSNLAGLSQAIEEALPAYVYADSVSTRIVKALHGDSSGVRGAAWLWSDRPQE